MRRIASHHRESEGRRGSRIDFEEGAAIRVFPETEHSQARRVSREPGAVQAVFTSLLSSRAWRGHPSRDSPVG
jgi:hypothetical protein